jgi:hypothetical protein
MGNNDASLQRGAGLAEAGEGARVAERKQTWGFNVPDHYGDDKVVLMVRDPWTVFSYWEIRGGTENRIREEISRKGLTPARKVLRAYDITDDLKNMAYEYELKDWSESWYIHGDPGREWMAEVGILCTNGEFFCIARSNTVRTPLNRMSDIQDSEWACPEDLYYKMFTVAGGQSVGKSSLEIKELIDRHLKKWLSSGGIVSKLFGSASFFMGRKR